ncbi:hypothetical protein [Ethanoligenens sp.]|uniref:hypothetical protein n=1 Tax=Ethanoligenens sp. TaxID=2099655 RepID=UPI0039E7FEDB
MRTYAPKDTPKKKKRALLCTAIAAALLFVMPGLPALAYINRGTVAVNLGTANAQVAVGQTLAISAILTPAAHDELPGCGMAFCPQQCSPGCVNSTGDCACNGKDYTTYKAGMMLTSANTNVATAAYTDGVITITGCSAGTTTISAVGTLRQYSSSASQTIRVTVTGNRSDAATEATGSQSNTTTQTPSAVDPTAVQTVTGQLGTFDFLQIAPGKSGKAEFDSIQGKDKTATFEKKDASGNVSYSWSFKGTDVTKPMDMDFTVAHQSKNESAMKQAGTLIEPFYLSFAHEGALPGKATIVVNTGSYYPSGTTLYLYTYNSQTKKLELTGGNVKLDNGFASFAISHCSDYVLVTRPVTPHTAVPLPLLAALCAIAAAAIAAAIMFVVLRRTSGAETLPKEVEKK